MKIDLPIRLRSAIFPTFAVAGFLGLLTTLVAALVPMGSGEEDGERSVRWVPVELEAEETIAGDMAAAEDIRFELPADWAADGTAAGTAAAGVATIEAPRHDPAAVLSAIAHVETAGDSRRIGRHGERGMYQFRQATWRQHTRTSFHQAHNPTVATVVAERHYNWIVESLRAKGREATPYEVALAWNAGLSRVISGRAPARSHHYAERVANLAGTR